MGKRTHERSEVEILYKIRRLEKELSRRNEQSIPDRNEGQGYDQYYEYQDELELEGYDAGDTTYDESALGPAHETEPTAGPTGASRSRPTPFPVGSPSPVSPQSPVGSPSPAEDSPAAANNQLKSVVVEVQAPLPVAGPSNQPDEENIPAEILEVLGEAKQSEEAFGKKIPSEISERWGKILVEGLAKEQKEALLTKMLVPENFIMAKAPKLNPEVASVLMDAAKNRDRRLEKMQNQLGAGIAGLANLTSELINSDLSKIEIIKKLSETNQILLDLHYEETINRRKLIIPMLDKSFINIIQSVKRDKYLFGDNLGENIRSTKSLEKSGLQIKKPVPVQTSYALKRNQGQQGNSRAPPRSGGSAAGRAPLAPLRYYPAQPMSAPPRRLPAAPLRRPPPPPPPPPPRSRPQDSSYDRRPRR
ncbi:hypothetical protein O0L34_g15294 [Tuta absoluta]|nr:hypothetical protein O0L34_g15294 [Tuta absoluta]